MPSLTSAPRRSPARATRQRGAPGANFGASGIARAVVRVAMIVLLLLLTNRCRSSRRAVGRQTWLWAALARDGPFGQPRHLGRDPRRQRGRRLARRGQERRAEADGDLA